MLRFFQRLSLSQILVAGLIFRLLAAVFAKGFAFTDDHFETAELVLKWKSGISFSWAGPVHIFSLIYPGLLYLVFDACNAVGINAPEHMMLVVNMLHALVSMCTVYFGYRLALRCTDDGDAAKVVALVLALFWIFPFLSVRTLREFFCIPFLFIGSYYLADKRLANRSIILAGLFFALAFCIRLQSVLFVGGFGLCLLLKKEYSFRAVLFGLSFLVFCLLTQGLFDYLHYGNPMASTMAYFQYNADSSHVALYPQGPWYQYIGTVFGITLGIPFFILAWGYFYSATISFQSKMLFIGSLLFFVFHSYYSNKQERFILPFIPYFLLLGVIGFREYYIKNETTRLRKATRFAAGWFLILNTIGLFIFSFAYSKRSRVEAMIYLRKKGDVSNIVVAGGPVHLGAPLFYLGRYVDYYIVNSSDSVGKLQAELQSGSKPLPNYVIFTGNKELDERVQKMRSVFPGLQEEKIIEPSFVDNIAYRLNPKHNINESWYIYRVK